MGTLQNVYQDGALTTPFSQSPTPITADINGRFPAIYLDPSKIYQVVLKNSAGTILENVDPYVPAPYNLQAVFKAAATTFTTTGYNIDPDLQIVVPQPATQATYAFELFLEFTTVGSTGVTPGLDWEVEYSGTLVPNWAKSFGWVGNLDGADANGGFVNQATPNNSLTGAGALNGLFIRGVFTTSTSGTFSFNWGQANASSNGVTLSAGCVMTLQRVA
jgi:hypothetical protein